MPIDAVFLESLRCELQEQLLACRVDKVQQPERDPILLSMRGPNGGGKLLPAGGWFPSRSRRWSGWWS